MKSGGMDSGGVIRPADLTGRQRYRLMTSLVVPRPIAWIGTRSRGGGANLAPFSYFNALSAAPMLVGVSIGMRRRAGSAEAGRGEAAAKAMAEKDTLLNIRETGAFSVSMVTERHLEVMVRTSGEWPEEIDEFQEAGLLAGECETVAAPFVAGAPAVMECRLFRIVELGSAPNTLVIGEVQAVRLSPELAVDGETLHVDVASLRPVGRLGLDEYTLLGETRRVARPGPPGDRGNTGPGTGLPSPVDPEAGPARG